LFTIKINLEKVKLKRLIIDIYKEKRKKEKEKKSNYNLALALSCSNFLISLKNKRGRLLSKLAASS